MFGNYPECQKTVQYVQKLSRLSRNFPESTDIFQSIWKLQETFQRLSKSVQKLSRVYRNFPECSETFQGIRILSRWLVKQCMETLQSFQKLFKYSFEEKKIIVLWNIEFLCHNKYNWWKKCFHFIALFILPVKKIPYYKTFRISMLGCYSGFAVHELNATRA